MSVLAFAALLLRASVDHDKPVWSKHVVVRGIPLDLRIYSKRNAATEVEIRRRGAVLKIGEGETYFWPEQKPYVRIDHGRIYLAYAATPGAGSGEYAIIWKIWDGGRQIKLIGSFLYADLRHWFGSGVILEFRPAKYASGDMMKKFPKMFDDSFYSDKHFIASYKFDRDRGEFKFLDAWMGPAMVGEPDSVRFPRSIR